MMTGEESINALISRYPQLEGCRTEIVEAAMAIIDCIKKGGKLLICGNGGSSADADHMVGELMKSFEKSRPLNRELKQSLDSVSDTRGAYIAEHLQGAVPAISLSAQTALTTAIANDMDPSLVFAQQVAGYGHAGDILIALSTSGNSQNIIDAAITSKAKGLTVIGLTGQSGGELKPYCHIAICAPAVHTAEVQEYHLPIYHTLCKIVENSLYL